MWTTFGIGAAITHKSLQAPIVSQVHTGTHDLKSDECKEQTLTVHVQRRAVEQCRSKLSNKQMCFPLSLRWNLM